MKMLILAAGEGVRLYPLTKNRPKLLIKLDKKITLLDKQMELFAKSGAVKEVIYIVGPFATMVEEKLSELSSKYSIISRTIYNPFYDVSNNLISLWLARHEFDQDITITNGDNLFTPDVFEKIKQIKDNGIFLTISLKDEYDEDDMKVRLDDNHKLLEIGKYLATSESNAESVGLVRINGCYARDKFQESLEALVRIKENRNCFWLETFNHLRSANIVINTVEIDGSRKWREIDFHIDVKYAQELVYTISELEEA